MRLSFKWLTVPFSNATRQVEAVQMWEVRWWSRSGNRLMGNPPSYVDAYPELECFTSEQEAVAFEESLENAFKLLRYSGGGISVQLVKAK